MDKTIGRIVRELMLEHELSYDGLARIAGLSHVTVRGIVEGRIRKPRPRTIARLARAFGRDPKEFADFLVIRMERTQRIAENIRAIAARKRIKIRDLAEATGTPYATMYAYYHGHFSIPDAKLTQIATALGVTPEALTEEANHA